jgi:hypothetical protein
MNSSLEATFETRREAELVIERLVQEFHVDRAAIHVGPEGDKNTVGERPSGGDTRPAEPSEKPRSDAPLEGRVRVSVALDEGADIDAVRSAFSEFSGEDLSAH